MPLRTSAWGPRKACRFVGRGALRERCPAPAKGRSRAWRTFGRRGVAIRIPAGKLGKLVVLRANSLRLTNSPEVLLSVTPYRRSYGLPRRFAPRNDNGGTYLHPRTRLSFCMSLRTSAHTGVAIRFPRRETWQVGSTSGEFVVLFRICPRRCFLLCCAAGVRIATSLRSSQ